MNAFAGWNLIGCTAVLLKDQGVNILLNLFYGPILNAARGIAGSVNVAVCSFANNFMAALNPQITKSYALGDSEYVVSLIERGSRFSFYIIFIIALPILLETDFVLTLWLKQYPIHSINFVRLALLLSLCDILSNTLITLQLATGKIKNYQLVVGGMYLMNFPLSYFFLKIGFQPEVVYVVALMVAFCCLGLRLVYLNKMTGLIISEFVQRVCLNVFLVMVVASFMPILIFLQMESSLYRFVIVSVVSLLSSGFTIYYVGCSKNERAFILLKAFDFRNRLLKVFRKEVE